MTLPPSRTPMRPSWTPKSRWGTLLGYLVLPACQLGCLAQQIERFVRFAPLGHQGASGLPGRGAC